MRISIRVGLFHANTLIPLLRLHSLAFGFGTFASQKTKLPCLTTVCYGKSDTDATSNQLKQKILVQPIAVL